MPEPSRRQLPSGFPKAPLPCQRQAVSDVEAGQILQLLLSRGEISEAKKLLAAHPRIPALRSSVKGRTLLHEASIADNDRAVMLLCAAGAEADAYDLYGYAPLHYAASMLHTATIRALVDCPNGANINTETHDGERAVHLVARRQNLSILKLLCKRERGADVSAVSGKTGESALHISAACDWEEGCKELLKAGADASVKTSDERRTSPLHIAASRDWVEGVRLFLNEGAPGGISMLDAEGRRPVHLTDNTTIHALLATPSCPRRLMVEPLTHEAVELVWDPPITDGALPIYYSIERCLRTEKISTLWTGLTEREKIISGLLPGEAVCIRVRVTSTGGTAVTDWVHTRTYLCAPSAPVDIEVRSMGINFISIGWRGPGSTGGGPITSYRLAYCEAVGVKQLWMAGKEELSRAGMFVANQRGQLKKDATTAAQIFEEEEGEYKETVVHLQANAKQYMAEDLIPHHVYAFRICRRNADHWSEWSNILYASTKPKPSTPPLDAVQLTCTDASVTIEWNPPNFNGGPNTFITSYRVESLSGGELWCGTTCRATIKGLSPLSITVVRIRAFNDFWWSEPSEALQCKTSPAAPPPPEALRAVVVQYSRVELRWDVPTRLFAGKKYKFKGFQLVCEDLFRSISTDGMDACVDGLQADTTYTFHVIGSNGIEWSGPSRKLTLKTMPRPEARCLRVVWPRKEGILRHANDELTLTWTSKGPVKQVLVELLHALVHGDSSEEFRVAWKKLVVNKTPVSDIKLFPGACGLDTGPYMVRVTDVWGEGEIPDIESGPISSLSSVSFWLDNGKLQGTDHLRTLIARRDACRLENYEEGATQDSGNGFAMVPRWRCSHAGPSLPLRLCPSCGAHKHPLDGGGGLFAGSVPENQVMAVAVVSSPAIHSVKKEDEVYEVEKRVQSGMEFFPVSVGRWLDAQGRPTIGRPQRKPGKGWVWEAKWRAERTIYTDVDGYVYGTGPHGPWKKERDGRSKFRKRRWLRTKVMRARTLAELKVSSDAG